MTKEPTFRKKMSQWLSNEIVQWFVLLIFIGLTVWMNAMAYFLGLGFVLILLWSRRWEWAYIGLCKPKGWLNLLLQSLLYAIILLVSIDVVLTPFLEHLMGEQVDLSSFDGLRNNILGYFTFILFMWVFAAFGEEFVYRGIMIERLAALIGNTKAVKWFAVFISSVLFGLAHQYQGVSGMLTTGMVGFILGALFISNKQRLWLTILTHGLYDMIGLTLIYLDMERMVYELISLPG